MNPIPRDFNPGDPITADDLNQILAELRNPSLNISSEGGIEVNRGPRGQIQIASVGRNGFIGKAAANIPPRSGTAWGTGTVTPLAFDGTNEYNLFGDGATIDVVNPSVTTMTSGHGIDSGMRVYVFEIDQGWRIVVPLECA